MQHGSRLWAAALMVFGTGLALHALQPVTTAAQPGARPAKPGVAPQPGQPVRPGTLPPAPAEQPPRPEVRPGQPDVPPRPGGLQPGGQAAAPVGGPRYTVVHSEGVNLLVVDNASNTLYFYTCDRDQEAGADLKLRGSIDLNQVGQQTIRARGHPSEDRGRPAPGDRPTGVPARPPVERPEK